MATKKVKLTHAEWDILKDLVHMAQRGEHRLGIPLDITNGDQSIKIDDEKIKIELIT
jgi:hypothetical protein